MFCFRWYPESSSLMPRFGLESMALHLQISVVGWFLPRQTDRISAFVGIQRKENGFSYPLFILFELFLRIRLQKLDFVFNTICQIFSVKYM